MLGVVHERSCYQGAKDVPLYLGCVLIGTWIESIETFRTIVYATIYSIAVFVAL